MDHSEINRLKTELAEAVGLLREIKSAKIIFNAEKFELNRRLVAFLAQAEQQEAGEMLPRVKHLLPMPAVKPPKPEAQGAQAGDERAAFRKEYDSFRQWAGSRLTARQLDLDEVGLFYDEIAGFAHDAWQARAALATQPAASEPAAWECFDGRYASLSYEREGDPDRAVPLFRGAPPAAAHGGITAEVLSPFLAVADAYDPAEDDAYVPAKDWMMDDALRLTLGQFRALKRAAAHGDGRSDADYAIEHGRYLANDADKFMKALNDAFDPETEETDLNDESISEARKRLASSVYEFRKRADRAMRAQGDGGGA